MSTPLGQILLKQHQLTDTQLVSVLNIQKHTGERLGNIIVGEGMLSYYQLYHAIAQHYGLPFIDLLVNKPDASLLSPKYIHDYLKLQLIPFKKEGEITHIALCNLDDKALSWIRKHYGQNYQLAITSPVDIRRTVEQCFKQQLQEESIHMLWDTSPEASAKVTLYANQQAIFWGILCLVVTMVVFNPISTATGLLILCHCLYSFTMLFKSIIFKAGTKPTYAPAWDYVLPQMDDRNLPVYTILIPMYREASTLPRMLDNMHRLDYPFSKLDIKLVLEADDHETINAAYALKPAYQFDIIKVPPSQPRTKPKACNYALRFARGEFVTVYDADDQPDPQQLKKAVHMFRTQSPRIVCLQARLNYYNYNENWLTRLFSLEYSMLFQVFLYGLQRLNIPIPLGGTSNHIALQKLRDLGEWDPYNVTEDADLGTRLAARGYKTVMLDSFTLEECPVGMHAWVRQRSRWIKGYMQTWLVHMRHPLRLYTTLGKRGFIGFQFFIGLSSFIFLSAPLVWLISLLWAGYFFNLHNIALPAWLITLSLFNLSLNIATHWVFSLYCSCLYDANRHRIIRAALLYPFYLVLHCIASYKALWQLAVKPHFWEKTTHGLSKKVQSLSLKTPLVSR